MDHDGGELERARNCETSPDELGRLACSENIDVALAALENPNTPDWAKSRIRMRTSETIPKGFQSAEILPRVTRPIDPIRLRRIASAEVQLAGIGSRIIAFMIDVFFAFLSAILLAFAVALLSALSDNDALMTNPMTLIGFWALYLAYWFVSYAMWGQTLGMWAAKIRVIDLINAGNPTWGRSILRAVLLQFWLLPFGAIILLIWTGTEADKRGPHDLLGRDLVVTTFNGRSVTT